MFAAGGGFSIRQLNFKDFFESRKVGFGLVIFVEQAVHFLLHVGKLRITIALERTLAYARHQVFEPRIQVVGVRRIFAVAPVFAYRATVQRNAAELGENYGLARGGAAFLQSSSDPAGTANRSFRDDTFARTRRPQTHNRARL